MPCLSFPLGWVGKAVLLNVTIAELKPEISTFQETCAEAPTPPPREPAASFSSPEIPEDWVNNPFVFSDQDQPPLPPLPPLPPRGGSPILPRPRPRASQTQISVKVGEDVYGCAWDVQDGEWEEIQVFGGELQDAIKNTERVL